jgi:Ca-activated chloride channel family protein
MRLACLALVLAAVMLVAGPSAQETIFRASTATVAIYATVTDRDGRLVSDLAEEHFEIYDDGVLQPLTLFRSDVQPITVVAMLDTSASMALNFEFLKVAAERFVLRLLPDDRARIGSFSDKIQISPTFTNDRDELIRYIYNDIQFGNPTFLWDAIDGSMTALSTERGRRVVLVFSDGEDERSQRVGFDDVIKRAQRENYMVYAIGLQSEILGRRTRPDRALRRLAAETGGGYFELSRTAELNSTFSQVADELHRQYVMGFTPQNLDGTIHKIEVRTKLPGMTDLPDQP